MSLPTFRLFSAAKPPSGTARTSVCAEGPSPSRHAAQAQQLWERAEEVRATNASAACPWTPRGLDRDAVLREEYLEDMEAPSARHAQPRSAGTRRYQADLPVDHEVMSQAEWERERVDLLQQLRLRDRQLMLLQRAAQEGAGSWTDRGMGGQCPLVDMRNARIVVLRGEAESLERLL